MRVPTAPRARQEDHSDRSVLGAGQTGQGSSLPGLAPGSGCQASRRPPTAVYACLQYVSVYIHVWVNVCPCVCPCVCVLVSVRVCVLVSDHVCVSCIHVSMCLCVQGHVSYIRMSMHVSCIRVSMCVSCTHVCVYRCVWHVYMYPCVCPCVCVPVSENRTPQLHTEARPVGDWGLPDS